MLALKILAWGIGVPVALVLAIVAVCWVYSLVNPNWNPFL